MKRVMKVRGRRPILLIDIAVPRDIDPEAGDLPGVRLHNVDDLEFAVAANMKGRHAEARKVNVIIEEELDAFEAWQRTLAIAPAIRALHERAEAIRHEELARTAAVLEKLPEEDRKRIEALAFAIEKKLLHQPIALLRAEAAAGNGHATAEALLRLFDLESEAEIPHEDGRTARAPTPRSVFVQDVLEA
jgi:glutamyl-tRNA reductase